MNFYSLTNVDGLSYSFVSCLEQGQNKLLWIGTGKGLNCYDGTTISRYYKNDSQFSLPHDKINSLKYTDKKKLFIGTEDGLCVFQDSMNNFIPIHYKGKSISIIHDIIKFKNNELFVTSSSGVYKVIDKENEIVVQKVSSNTNIKGIFVDVFHHIWMYTNDEVIYSTPDFKTIESYEIKVDNTLKSAQITSAFLSTSGSFWIGTTYNGLYRFDRKSHQFKVKYTGDIKEGTQLKYIRCINEDKFGRLWIGTENGLFVYNTNSDDFLHFTQSFEISKNYINDNAIYSIFEGQEGIMWIGTYFGGVNYTSLNATGFQNFIPDGGRLSLKGKAVSDIIEDDNNRLWIGTEDKGISIYSPHDNSFDYLTQDQNNKKGLCGNNVHALLKDFEGNIWAGTYMDGLNKINPSTFEVEQFKANKNSISNNSIYALYIGRNRQMYIGSMNGIDIYNFETKLFRQFEPELLKGKIVDDIIEDERGSIWISTYNSGLFRYNSEIDSMYNYGMKDGLHSNSFISSLIDSQSRLWFGTRGGGLIQYNYKTNSFIHYDTDDGLTENDVYGILEARDGFLWLSTNRGILKFNPITGKVVINYTTKHGIIADQFNFKSYYKDSNEMLYFGSVYGLTYFDPVEVYKTSYKSTPLFTSIESINGPIQNDSTLNLPQNINFAKEIILDYEMDEVTFSFTLPTYHPIVNSDYSYMLEGFDQDWKIVKNKSNKVSYTNLDPGNYTFRVKFSNDGNTFNTLEKSIKVKVLPHPLKTTYAFVLYGILLISILYIIYIRIDKRRKQRAAIKIAKIEENKKIELEEHKLNFFTNISHEFKTPLTIILALIEEMSLDSNNTFTSQTQRSFKTLERNALRLKFLISQLMEFREIETEHSPLILSKFDINKKINNIYTSFTVLFEKKGLNYTIKSNLKELEVVSDAEKIEKIFSNLFSNAFKYTKEEGKIVLETSLEKNNILLVKISNTGELLTNEDRERIFAPFYKKEKSIDNTGIGMAIVKSLTSLLSGEIELETEEELGNVFIIKLPLDTFCEKDINVNQEDVYSSFTKDLITSIGEDEYVESTELKVSDQKYNILIAEDNPDLSRHLKSYLSKYFNIRTAKNGKEAIKLVEKEAPDLIVSDVLMPIMGGLDLCSTIKKSDEFSHIPVILLTALSSDIDKIEALKQGADSYMSKPFSFEELKVKITNLLTSKSRLKQHFKDSGLLSEETLHLRNKDEELIILINQFINENIENENFGVEQLAELLSLSRSVLYGKIKTMTGLSTVDYINTIKLNKAKKMILSTDFSISEIAFKTGYSDANYFSRIFKKFNSISPTQYRKVNKETTETILE
ncbi:hybrid sensor histidine kinase/response regulator transcription factor [Flammeovirga kamogawensis]|uniref:histidine kinase n=1 Tax=Flammeovirga kamogawensis TaxID=373891 RepID=A0ABX8H0B8_9BACT|nr:two-component regulator propeller domain-containing protein [Flammeovirga kamogawensis]MBB6463657.1 ligand-binding sensor domain-containing protein/signal transduction histidine kinase/DNA-binding response OmpR family regulator [Flammeovirga kamogawensis]QWG09270.1 response regulator [Flammeovirga kamogawensis]